jgi:hypothetical protein
MITNAGKEIISKYMLGQVAGYATHLSVGCGAIPIKTNEDPPALDILLRKSEMDFEMTRVPIVSKGFVDNSKEFTIVSQSRVNNIVILTTNAVNDITVGETIVVSGSNNVFNGTHIVIGIDPSVDEIYYNLVGQDDSVTGGTVRAVRTSLSLTAELPADSRYEITEVGIWSAANNSLAGTYDSHNIFNFTNQWQEHSVAISTPPTITNFGSSTDINQNVVTQKVFYTPTNSEIFENTIRKNRKEGPRFLNTTLMVRGDTSQISGLAGQWTPTGATAGETPIHVHLNNLNFDISRNSPSDKLNFAFSLVDRDSTGNIIPEEVKVLLEFFTNESNTQNAYAKLEMYFDGNEFLNNRYKSISLPISQGIGESNKNNSNVVAASGNGTLLTFTTDKPHGYEIGEEVTTYGAGLPIDYQVSSSQIVQKTSISFTVESSTTGSLVSLTNSFAYTFSNYRFITSPDFSSRDIRVCRVFASVIAGGVPSLNHYLSFDGMRLENVSTENPLYKMTGYSVVKNPNGYPIVKSPNTNSFIEFRFNLGVS